MAEFFVVENDDDPAAEEMLLFNVNDRVPLEDLRAIIGAVNPNGRVLDRVVKFALGLNAQEMLEPSVLQALIEYNPKCTRIQDENVRALLHEVCDSGMPIDVIEFLVGLDPDSVRAALD